MNKKPLILIDPLDRVGNTPVIRLPLDDFSNINLYAKLEFTNPTGSVKDRAASYVLETLLARKDIDQDTTIIESSSGNFGISLSTYCKKFGLKFICVVDPHINPMNESLLKMCAHRVIKVKEPDEFGGYLLNRIKKVKELTQEISNSYWINQYSNPLNAEAYYSSLGQEISDTFDNLDYMFIGVSSGGTIAGVSRKLKEKFPNIKIIAVDIVGSVIFRNEPRKRHIPGIGSSIVPDILKQASIDDVVLVDEISTFQMCHELFNAYSIHAGGSSGSAMAAVKTYFKDKKINKEVNVLTLFPDRGERYMDTIYNPQWCEEFTKNKLDSQQSNRSDF